MQKNIRKMVRSHPRRCGSVLVEFALVVPTLLLLTFGIIQYGIIMNSMNALTQISREGARFAALNPSNDDAIKAYISTVASKTLIKYSDLTTSPGSITILPSAAGSRTSGTGITVTLTYPMSKKLFLPSTFFGASIFASTATQSSTFVIEGTSTTNG